MANKLRSVIPLQHYIISIEKNKDTFELFRALWKSRGIDGIRVETMTEGIKKAIEIERSKTDELYFIDIVADDVTFMPQLEILSAETNAPILIATSAYDKNEHHEALNNGADFYGAYFDTPETNIDAVIASINSVTRRSKKQNVPNKILAHGDILIAVNQHKAFIKDMELSLTNSELRVLQYMMINRGNILSHKQIYRNSYNDAYDELSPDIIYSTIKRLRKKIRKITSANYIETVKNMGYRLFTKAV